LRKVILFIGSSLDSYIAREDGTIDWLFTDGDYGYKQFYDSVDLYSLEGRHMIKSWNLPSLHLKKTDALSLPSNLILHMILISSLLTIP